MPTKGFHLISDPGWVDDRGLLLCLSWFLLHFLFLLCNKMIHTKRADRKRGNHWLVHLNCIASQFFPATYTFFFLYFQISNYCYPAPCWFQSVFCLSVIDSTWSLVPTSCLSLPEPQMHSFSPNLLSILPISGHITKHSPGLLQHASHISKFPYTGRSSHRWHTILSVHVNWPLFHSYPSFKAQSRLPKHRAESTCLPKYKSNFQNTGMTSKTQSWIL